MKKFVLAFGIPVLAVASLIGSGYATWYFNNAVESVVGKIGVNITPKQVVGAKFKPLENNTEGNIKDLELVLDQTDKTGKNDDGMPHNRMGVHLTGALTESLIADDGDPNTSNDTFVSGTTYEITTTITIPSAVATYVNFTFKGSTASEDGLTLTKVSKYTVEADQQAHDFFNISHDTINSDVTVNYANEPSTLDAYNTMVKDVTGQTISISFAAKIVTVTK
jgi:hypothetical protein